MLAQTMEQRQQEGGRLAGARARHGDDVAAFHDHRYALALYRRRDVVALLVYRLQYRL